MNKKIALILGVVLIALAVVFLFPGKKDTVTSFEECVAAGYPVMESQPRQCRAESTLFIEGLPQTAIGVDQVRNLNVAPGMVVTSPLVVEGEARGNWFFEASLPVRLIDGNGKEIAVAPAQAIGEWMTTEFVKFKTTLTFEKPATATGLLRIEKDNPSGLPENAGYHEVPVTFQ